MTLKPPSYYILSFPLYGKFVFYGPEYEAYEILLKTEAREHERGKLRKANPDSMDDRKMVMAEILASREDRANGVDVKFLPQEGWYV